MKDPCKNVALISLETNSLKCDRKLHQEYNIEWYVNVQELKIFSNNQPKKLRKEVNRASILLTLKKW